MAGDAYTLVDDVIAPGNLDDGHVVDHEIQRLLSEAWFRYVATVAMGIADDGPAAAARMTTTCFEAECVPGEALRRGIRAVARTRRSYTVESALWRTSDSAVIATSRVVLVGIDRATGRALAISDALWAAVESLERKTIPVKERGAD